MSHINSYREHRIYDVQYIKVNVRQKFTHHHDSEAKEQQRATSRANDASENDHQTSSMSTWTTAFKDIESSSPSHSPHGFREICANYDNTHITLYAAFSNSIADAAVTHQRLSAAPAFKPTRMTWVKPSWCWMMYRCGYSYKDAGQERVLALKVRRDKFVGLLRTGRLADHGRTGKEGGGKEENGEGVVLSDVVVQWDPERGPRLERYTYRSIQIGTPAGVIADIVEGIEDVTSRARKMKRVLDEDGSGQIGVDELTKMGLMPVEKAFEVDGEIRKRLEMDIKGD